MVMHVSNLDFYFQDDDLRKLFGNYGVVTSAKIITDMATNKSRGFGFVEMNDNDAAETAMRELNGKIIDGRSIKVAGNRPRE